MDKRGIGMKTEGEECQQCVEKCVKYIQKFGVTGNKSRQGYAREGDLKTNDSE